MTARPVMLGADPGASGGLALVYDDGTAEVHRIPETDEDMLDLCRELSERWPADSLPAVTMEDVQPGGLHAGRKDQAEGKPERRMGAKSAFTFGGNVRGLRVALLAAGFRMQRVSSSVWQKGLGLHAKGDKSILKARAQELFPLLLGGSKVTLWNADALLIAEWGRRQR